MSLKIAVIGAGAWGTALAISASRHVAGHQVQLWTRDAAAAKAMQAQRSNHRYLPDVDFPDALQCVSSPISELAPWAATQDLLVIGTPMLGLRGMLLNLKETQVTVAWLCKGFEAASGGVESGAKKKAAKNAVGRAQSSTTEPFPPLITHSLVRSVNPRDGCWRRLAG